MRGGNGGRRGVPFARPYAYRAGLDSRQVERLEAERFRLDRAAGCVPRVQEPPPPAPKPAPPSPSAAPGRCGSCGYLVTAPGHLNACGEADYPQTLGTVLRDGQRSWYEIDYDASQGTEAVYRFLGNARELDDLRPGG